MALSQTFARHSLRRKVYIKHLMVQSLERDSLGNLSDGWSWLKGSWIFVWAHYAALFRDRPHGLNQELAVGTKVDIVNILERYFGRISWRSDWFAVHFLAKNVGGTLDG